MINIVFNSSHFDSDVTVMLLKKLLAILYWVSKTRSFEISETLFYFLTLINYDFKVDCRSYYNRWENRWEEDCNYDGFWMGGYIIGVSVFGALCAAASIMLFAALMCLRCKVCFTDS